MLAPMARFRADAQHVSGQLAVEYYKQRTSVPGTLAITEGTMIAAQAGGYKERPWHMERRADQGVDTGSSLLDSLQILICAHVPTDKFVPLSPLHLLLRDRS